MIGYQQAYAIPDSNMLDVPYHALPAGLAWCCAASVQMALHYISGDVVPQDVLAREMSESLYAVRLDMMYKAFYSRGYAVAGLQHATLDQLKEWNSQGHVSIILIWFDLSRKLGHCVVVVGYNEAGIFVNDPAGRYAFISNDLLSNLWSYYDEWALEIPYGSGMYSMVLSVVGLTLGRAAVTVDGTPSGLIGGNMSFHFKLGTEHVISVEQYVLTFNEGTRFFAADNTVTVTEQATCYTIKYVEQHRLLVEAPSGLSEKWFASDETAALGPYDEILPVDSGTRYFFMGLIVDGVEQQSNTLTVPMDQPHKVTVQYATQYLLTIVSEFGDPKGEDWYTSGDTAAYSVRTPYGFLIQHVFVGWTGDATSTEPQGTLTMTHPYTIQAKWRTDYTQLVMVLVVASVAITLLAVVLSKREHQQ